MTPIDYLLLLCGVFFFFIAVLGLKISVVSRSTAKLEEDLAILRGGVREIDQEFHVLCDDVDGLLDRERSVTE